jgi:amino acid transporter
MRPVVEQKSSLELRRVLTFWPLLFYGLGVIVGAGIYVATATVIQRAGHAAPFSFLLAGVVAGLTGLCYAELGARFPEAAGGASYVETSSALPLRGDDQNGTATSENNSFDDPFLE